MPPCDVPSCVASDTYVLVLDRFLVDAARRRGDPSGHLSGLADTDHQRLHMGPIGLTGQPSVDRRGPLLRVDEATVGTHVPAPERAHVAMESDVWQFQRDADPGVGDRA